jgi:uncharacterized protein YyaL (SSP411 family)
MVDVMPNRLAQQTSPYLLQHKDNPVDWYPWGPEALGRAKEDDRPILLSIGYSACHWCHVMEHESFEDSETARYMNEHFVPIKVDREERPDVDSIYMQAVQAMTGHGGWPLTVFLDPGGVPFYGGTYFPPEPRHGMPSFKQVMEGVTEAWRERRSEIESGAEQIVRALEASTRLRPPQGIVSPRVLDDAERALAQQFDPVNGGFAGAPKFPPASTIEFLMRRMAVPGDGGIDRAKREGMVRLTLERMARGGMYDQIGGGFHRYSVDAHWLVPHFEKMLYDNALLARAYLHGWQLMSEERFLRVCTQTLDWALREMRAPEGGFYSALDADSEGEEGKFYVWTSDEVRDVLGEDAEPLIAYLGLDAEPNFEGANVLHVAGGDIDDELLDSLRSRLYEARSNRAWPQLDDKRLTAWNALMLAALADAGAVLGSEKYLAAARDCADFLLSNLRDEHGRLLRTYKDGRASLNAYLEDYAFLVEALLILYEATLEAHWFVQARSLADDMIQRYSDPAGGFFSTAVDHEPLVTRPKDIQDHPIPSGNSSAAFALLRLAAFTGLEEYERPPLELFRLLHEAAGRHPQAFGHLLQAMHFHFAPRREVALVGDSLEPLLRVVRGVFRPNVVLAGMRPGDPEARDQIPLLRGREALDGRPAAYVCEKFACKLPVSEPEELARLLDEATPDRGPRASQPTA